MKSVCARIKEIEYHKYRKTHPKTAIPNENKMRNYVVWKKTEGKNVMNGYKTILIANT